MGTNAVIKGAVAKTVANNVKTVRENRRWSQQQLAAELAAVGRPMQPSAVAKVEKVSRRVDVDDLVAFAIALNVSPARLLFEEDAEMDAEIGLTSEVSAPGWSVWQWLTGYRPLQAETDDIRNPDVQARSLAYLTERPTWLRAQEAAPLMQAAHRVVNTAGLALRAMENYKSDSAVVPARLRATRRAVDNLSNELDELEAEADDAAR
jgi:transcriptional regulator with XRE-family HTH domain